MLCSLLLTNLQAREGATMRCCCSFTTPVLASAKRLPSGSDIDWHSKSVRITGKGKKQRRCPLWSATLGHLRHLAGQRPAEANLFVNRRGEPLTRYGIHTLVERY